jgi:hypothetical protein
MDTPKSKKRLPLVTTLVEMFGLEPGLASIVALVIMGICALALVWVVRSAPPRKLVLTSGPDGSSFRRWADNYQKRLAKEGITLEILPSAGSLDNLQRLQAADSRVDIGFAPGGLVKDADFSNIVSLGSIAYQPLFIFYRGEAPIERLAELAGRRIAIGAEGSGTRALAKTLLAANGITGAPTTFVDLDSEAAASALLDGKLDAVFLMGDSAPMQSLRTLVRSRDIRLFNFHQADAYVRRFPYLTRIVLPEGSIDLGKNLPADDVILIGPTVELVARQDINPAISDLLLDIAQEVHGRASILQKRGEFPAPLAHEFKLSDDAARYYKSGKSILYRKIHNFWLASLLNRLFVAIVPLIIVLVPIFRVLPIVYRFRIRLRIFRCYRPLLRIEREAFGAGAGGRIPELLRRLDAIEHDVDQLRVPASFADQFYELRQHVAFARRRLESAAAATT